MSNPPADGTSLLRAFACFIAITYLLKAYFIRIIDILILCISVTSANKPCLTYRLELNDVTLKKLVIVKSIRNFNWIYLRG